MGKHLAVKFPVLASTAGNALSKQSVEPRGEARGKEQDNGGRWAEAEVVCTAQFGRVAVPCRLCYCMNAVRTSGCAAWSEGFFVETVGIVPGERVVTMAGSLGLWERSAVLRAVQSQTVGPCSCAVLVDVALVGSLHHPAEKGCITHSCGRLCSSCSSTELLGSNPSSPAAPPSPSCTLTSLPSSRSHSCPPSPLLPTLTLRRLRGGHCTVSQHQT